MFVFMHVILWDFQLHYYLNIWMKKKFVMIWFFSIVWNLFMSQSELIDICMKVDIFQMISFVLVKMCLLWAELAEELTVLTRILFLNAALLLILCCLTTVYQNSDRTDMFLSWKLFCKFWRICKNANEKRVKKHIFAE